jgi:plasmid stabilization system protein ParE
VNYEVIFAPEAEADLDEIGQYLALRFSERNAEKYIRRIVAHCQSLTFAPYRGTVRDDVRRGLRTTGFERRVTILFEVQSETVIIFGISYAGRGLDPAR